MEGPNQADQIKLHADKKVLEFKQIVTNPKWEKIDDSSCLMYKMEINGRVASKGTCDIPYPIEDLVQFLQKEDTLRKLDFQCIQSKVVHEFEKDLFLGYAAFKGVWPVSGRDFSNLMKINREGDKAYLVSASVQHEKLPEVKGYVRADCICAGYLIQKLDDNNSRTTYLSFADLKGLIPGILKNKLAINQSKIVTRIKKNLDKQKK